MLDAPIFMQWASSTNIKRMVMKTIQQSGMLDGKICKINIMINVLKKRIVERERNYIKLLTLVL